MKVKECVNSDCNNTFYVKDNQLHMCLQCTECIERRKKENIFENQQ